MPFYEYQCSACEHRLEVLQKISDEPLSYCPECGEATLKKLISRSAFRLKGGGWYETDFKDSAKNSAGKSGDTKKETSASQSTSSESKNESAASTGKKDSASKKSSASAQPMKESA